MSNLYRGKTLTITPDIFREEALFDRSSLAEKLYKSGSLLVTIYVTKRKEISIGRGDTLENLLFRPTVDFIKPFLLNAVD